ncbi:hypothetical protein B0G80_2041 [Paraburkholderia sp. BL6669N2]|nr:hypothetical protein B0G80_2041 [Paraburkholderia sp. BL6669N2]
MTIVVLATMACSSTPKHTNTLIFGTNTIIALDVSQSPTGNVGVTLGYKRQEAVWMPLLANDGEVEGNQIPAKCDSDDCRSFIGMTGGDGHVNGPGARDTYSVIATLSGETTGRAPVDKTGAEVSAGGSIAQYFATGMAARLLADKGGAALVNTNAYPAVSADIQTEAEQLVASQTQMITAVMRAVSKSDGTLDIAKRNALVEKSAISAPNIKLQLLKRNEAATFRDYLFLRFEGAAKPLYVAIK